MLGREVNMSTKDERRRCGGGGEFWSDIIIRSGGVGGTAVEEVSRIDHKVEHVGWNSGMTDKGRGHVIV